MDVPGAVAMAEDGAQDKAIVPANITTMVSISRETPNTIVPAHISTIAPELVFRIFDLLGGVAGQTCFGLTCRRFYKVLKAKHPGPIDLGATTTLKSPYCDNCKRSWGPEDDGCCETTLYHILATWIGPRYRHGYWCGLKYWFYNREVYGEIDGPRREENSLIARYMDYQLAQHLHKNIAHFTWHFRVASLPPLPSPFNKGDDWYEKQLLPYRKAYLNSSLLGIGSKLGLSSEYSAKTKSFSTKLRMNTYGDCGLKVWS